MESDGESAAKYGYRSNSGLDNASTPVAFAGVPAGIGSGVPNASPMVSNRMRISG